MPSIVRVRFAPSPTGPLHLGGVRTALYNYLFAKKNKGTFILRIEDTDKKRFLSISESYILETLKWCGIEPDEGVGYGGPYTPYYQSKRGHIYQFYLNELLKKGDAYYAFDTDYELEKKRKEYKKIGLHFSYDHKVRMNLSNSLTMNKESLYDKLKNRHPYVIRFKVKPGIRLKVYDLIRGNIEINTDYLDDKILLKSDGIPTYHLANTIDDHVMKITHVLRGEEWIPSMFFHILIYKSFEWKPPLFAHLPLILKNNGKGKISKRYEKNSLDFPVLPIQWKVPNTKIYIPGYRELGYFPESFINMLALLGWNPGNDREIFSLQELIDFFSIKKITKSGIFFDKNKAIWFNKQYIKYNKKKIFIFLSKELKKRFLFNFKEDYLWKVINLTMDRIHFVNEIWKHSFYFFIPPNSYDEDFLKKIFFSKKYATKDTISRLEKVKNILNNSSSKLELINQLKFFISQLKKYNKITMQLVRLSLVGSLKGVDLFLIIEILGKKESIIRIEKLLEKIKFL
ncbi:glutamate--tRNA ligase [Blattabacterium cuenoti]|uniref:glutamate--tRNA ligase n=1 Tax=Blattabacterium cuenoti TaxID=1653831 RepID=UPI00163C53DF|nr:glutamate--tRNA ligase [Blattabacterium cuenoti]